MDDDAINAHLGRNVRIRRRLLGMSQRQLAERSGIACPQQIQKYESGTTMYVTTLLKLAKALDVPIDYFYEGLAKA